MPSNQESPSSVSVVGLGPMGRALARTFRSGNHAVTAYNRTLAKAHDLAADGIKSAASMAEALRASPITVVCVADYAAAEALLGESGVAAALPGRVLVHLSTGIPREARTLAAKMTAAGAAYLDGALLVTPPQIGTPDGALLVAGSEDAYRSVEPLLKLLGPGLQYVGSDPGAAAALDLAFLSHFFGGLLGFYHGARIMEAEHLPVTQLGEMIQAVAPALGHIIHHDSKRIAENHFDDPQSSLANSATVVELIFKHAREAQLDAGFPRYATDLFRKGLAAGDGHRDVAALMRVLRSVR